jgi:hypothetical protein
MPEPRSGLRCPIRHRSSPGQQFVIGVEREVASELHIGEAMTKRWSASDWRDCYVHHDRPREGTSAK